MTPQTPTWWLQTKVFVSSLGNNFVNEFKQGGCVNCSKQKNANTNVNGHDQDPVQHKAQQQNSTSNVPGKFVIIGSKDKGSFSLYQYQLENAKGQPLKGNGYAVEEHISGANGPVKTSEHTFVPANHGVATDNVGYSRTGPNGQPQSVKLPENFFRVTTLVQTFTVSYQGKEYNLPTVFEHYTMAVAGTAVNEVIDVTDIEH